jgi:HNH endonuclease
VAHSDDTRRIPLPRGLFALVDAADYDWLTQWPWHANNMGYVLRRERGTRRHIRLHRLLCGIDGVSHKVAEVDHLNHDPLDNRRANLRVVTHRQNMLNRKKGRGAWPVGEVPGVRLRPSGRWEAAIKVGGVPHYLGLFDTAEEASSARARFLATL